MKIVFVTLALDAMPFIASHYWQFRQLTFPWEWRVVEGVAAPVGCTSWVRQIAPRLSDDGTTEYLDSLTAFDPRVILFRKALWPGKVAMLNAALKTIHEACLLVEVDHDELWTATQLENIRWLFNERPEKNAAYFRCRYFVGRDIAIANTDGEHFGNHHAYEWLRAWRFEPGQNFETHEPPKLSGGKLNPFTHAETGEHDLIFDHFAYATEAQIRFKSEFYGSANNQNGAKYTNAVEGWRRLQANTNWPVRELSDFLPWVGPGVTADRV